MFTKFSKITSKIHRSSGLDIGYMVSPYFGIEAAVLPPWYFHSSFSRKLLSLYWTCPHALKMQNIIKMDDYQA